MPRGILLLHLCCLVIASPVSTTSPNVNNVANLISGGMNETIKPCDDFYNYGCGSWAIKNPTPPTKKYWNLNEIVTKKVQNDLKNILEEDITSRDNQALKKEKIWYTACMDEEKLKQNGFKTVGKIIENIGGWPMTREISEWNENDFPWQRVTSYLASTVGAYGLFELDFNLDPTNSSVYMLKMVANDILLSTAPIKFFYNGPDFNSKEEKELLVKVSKAYAKSINGTTKNINQDIKEVLKFRKNLLNISIVEDEDDQITITIDELQQLYDKNDPGYSTTKINWLKIMNNIRRIFGSQLSKDEKIIVWSRKFIEKLPQILKETSHRTIVNYNLWKLAKDSLIYLDEEKRQWHADMVKDISRWEYCLDNMIIRYGINEAYIKKHLSESKMKTATEMSEKIRQKMKGKIENLTRPFEQATKIFLEKRLDVMQVHVGYPDYYKNASFFEHVYDEIEIGQDYLQNIINYIKYDMKTKWETSRKPIVQDQSFMPESVIPLFYNPENGPIITAAKLSTPLFDTSLPKSIRYGSVGFFLAERFLSYFGFEDDVYWPMFFEENVDDEEDGQLRETMKISEHIGLDVAFEVFEEEIGRNKLKNERLPGLENINDEQLFFITFAASMCSNTPPATEVNEIVSKSKHFSRVFNCPEEVIFWQ